MPANELLTMANELLTMAIDFIKPYIDKGTYIDNNGVLAQSYYEGPLWYCPMYDVYEDLRAFIKDVTIRHRTLEEGEGNRLWMILDHTKEPRDYSVVLRIIFSMIRMGLFTKQQVVDAVSKTENIPALVELIKYDDYSVFNERKLEL